MSSETAVENLLHVQGRKKSTKPLLRLLNLQTNVSHKNLADQADTHAAETLPGYRIIRKRLAFFVLG